VSDREPPTVAGFRSLIELLDLLVDPHTGEHLSVADCPAVTVVKLDGSWLPEMAEARLPSPRSGVLIGIDHDAAVPEGLGGIFDVLLTCHPCPGREWVSVAPEALPLEAERLYRRALANPLAASVFARVLRLSERLPFADGLVLESVGYSALLAGAEFRRWRAANPPRMRGADADTLVTLSRRKHSLRITLNRPHLHNALNDAMRHQLAEALRNAAADPAIERITLDGEGPSFCSGGDLAEFGSAADQPSDQPIRLAQSVAGMVQDCGDTLSAHIHGACFGAGIEIPAAARSVVAAPDARFYLPEVHMGLIPGAGGTVTIRRRIGRHRTAWLGLSARPLTAMEALAWGLIDGIEAHT
jgi:enoyl-CoA hydratase/carnithine racemase